MGFSSLNTSFFFLSGKRKPGGKAGLACVLHPCEIPHMKDPVHRTPFQVRDYECDLQGVVNNAVYQNYLEHARHTFLLEQGIDFAALTRQGILLVVIRIELNYRQPLVSRDSFQVLTSVERLSRLKFGFHQKILKIPDDVEILNGLVTGTALNAQRRPEIPPAIDGLIPWKS